MAITNNDVKLLKSERLTDTSDGGGRATGNAVIDNEMNNLFRDISRLDRTTGRISLRKVYAGVVTQTNDPYLGVHSILTQRALDPRVSVLLFNTESQTDMRDAARSSIESYMAPSATASWELLGDQLIGQRAIVAVQRQELPLPEVGEVFQLVSGSQSQYVRVVSLDATVETFTYQYSSGSWVDFQRRRLVMEISAPLNLTFPGGEANPSGTTTTSVTSGATKSRVLTTQVADAARYYGIRPVVEPIALGALTVKVDGLYSQLVPSTTKENALTALLAGYERGFMMESGSPRAISCTVAAVGGTTSRTFIGAGVLPGSTAIVANGGTYTDDKAGNLIYVSGTNWLSSGFIDYASGEVTFNKTGSAWTGSAAITYTPAAQVLGDAITFAEAIELGNRGYVYTLNLAEALPRPGTLTVSYMTLGKWYDIKDNGRGEMTGMGTGAIDYASGAAQITLQALPDVGSALVYSYVGQADFALSTFSGTVAAQQIRVSHTIEAEGILPGSLVVSYTSGGEAKTITDNGMGMLQGAGSGFINYSTGKVDMVLAAAPDGGVSFSFENGALVENLINAFSPDAAGMATFTIQGGPFKPGSITLEFSVQRKRSSSSFRGVSSKTKVEPDGTEMRLLKDDGLGGWVDGTGTAVEGTVNYSTGECWVKVENDYVYTVAIYTVAPDRASYVAAHI